mgnify:CR=1 FL=1
MNYFAAHKILDRVKDGAKYPLHTINTAFELTGDRPEPHEGLREPRVAEALQGQSECFGGLRSPSMVA